MIGKSLVLLASLFAVASSQTSGAACSQNADCKFCNEPGTGCRWFVPNKNSSWPAPICRPWRECLLDAFRRQGKCIRRVKQCPWTKKPTEAPTGAPPAPFEDTCTYRGVKNDEGCAKGDFCKIGVGKCAPPDKEESAGILNPGDCPEDQCLDPSNGKCTSEVVECLVDPCEVTEECDKDLCTANYCGGCHAVCATGAAPQQEGVCDTPPERCTEEWDPVCGCDGATYGNECSAHGAGVNVLSAGCCPRDGREECNLGI